MADTSTSSAKRRTDFSIAALLASDHRGSCSKRPRLDTCVSVKTERPESPSSTTSCTDSLSLSPSLSPCQSPCSPLTVPPFPQWTQCQRDTKKSRRPYSRQTVTLLSWWFHHLPFLTVAEMEAVASLASLSRQQVKVWWQNRRHSQRGRGGEADPYLGHILHLPVWPHQAAVPDPASGFRQEVFRTILNFYISRVSHLISPVSVFT